MMTLKIILVTLSVICTVPFSNTRHVQRERVEGKTPLVNSDVDHVIISLRAISLVWGTFGNEFSSRIHEIEDKIAKLYMTEMIKKIQCQWTDQDQNNWNKKLQEIKLTVENGTKENDFLGLDDYKNKDLKPSAEWTLSFLKDMENLTKSLILGGDSDIVVVKFASYLREKMLLRQRRIPNCSWTEIDQKRAGKKIVKIINQFATNIVNGLTQQLEKKPGQIFSIEDKKSLIKEFLSFEQVYFTLFESFEQD